ncbi:hypothetical protein V2A60_004281 [Cordyceps javanica]
MHDHEDPAEIRRKMKKELQAKYKTVTFVNKSVTSVQESDGIFKLLDTDGGCWNGRKLILATGCFDILPNIVGYKESWGKGIFHCPFCHGFEQARNGSVSMAVLLSQQACPRELEEFWFLHTTLRQFSQKMTVLANGNTIQNLARPGIWAGETSVQPQVVARIEYVESDNHVAVEYCDGALDTFDMVYHSPATQLSGKLHADVGLDMHPAGAIQTVSPMQETSVRGVFAAGDCAGLLKKMAVAMGSGNKVLNAFARADGALGPDLRYGLRAEIREGA